MFGVHKTPGEVAESRQPRYPSLPPEEQLPEAEGVPEVEVQPAEQGRGVRQRFGWFRSGGPSVLPHPGHSWSRSRECRSGYGVSMQELLRGDVSSRSRVDTFGPLRGSQTSKAVALDVTERHSTTTGESEDHSCDRAAYQPSTSRRVLSSTKVELHEPPRRARPYGHKNRYLRSRVGVDPEGREACASSSNYLEGRNLSVSRKDSQLL